MKHIRWFLTVVVLFAAIVRANEPIKFNTQWISSKPEVLTFRSTSGQEEGFYQVSIMKRDSIIEAYTNMISPGFTKTVYGTMTLDMRPIQATGKIIINNQVIMDTRCYYENDKLRITTVMMPYNQTMSDSLTLVKSIVDFSQVSLLVRTLDLEEGIQYVFTSINPRTNTLVPLTIIVTGDGRKGKVDCYRVEMNNFEGISIYWVEKGSRHRIMLIEQPESHRTTELLE